MSRLQGYTHAPPLHPNLVLGSLHLLCWFFFHPSAWKHHLRSINLRPDFCLAEINWRQPQPSALKRLLIQGYVILPLLVGGVVGLGLWGLSVSGADMAFGMAVGMAASVAGSLAGGMVVGVAVSLASSFISGIVVGLLFGVMLGTTTLAELGWGLGSAAASVGVLQSFIHPVSLVGINASNVAASVAVSLSPRKSDLIPVSQKLGGAVLGIVLSLSGLWAVAQATTQLLRPGAIPLNTVSFALLGLGMGCFYGIALGWRTQRWRIAIPMCLGLGAFIGTAVGLGLNVNSAVVRGMVIGGGNAALLTTLFALPYVLTESIAGPWIAAIVGTIGSGGVYIIFASLIGGLSLQLTLPISLVCIALGLTMAQWRPILLYPVQILWNQCLYRLDTQRTEHQSSVLRWHTVFWDEFQYLPLVGLDQHLVLALESWAQEGQAAIDFIDRTPQRWAAHQAQVELNIRKLEQCRTIADICQVQKTILGEATEESHLFRICQQISLDVDAALQQRSSYNQRLALSAVLERLDTQRQVIRGDAVYVPRPANNDYRIAGFRTIFQAWHQIIAQQIETLQTETDQNQEIDSPYIIGIPLTGQQALFVGRTDISQRIEQLVRDDRSPALLLYGQRRMGKTSLLNNLGRLLPQTIIPLFVDLQGSASRAQDHTGFLYNLAKAMSAAAKQYRGVQFPPLERSDLAVDPFTQFEEWLDEVGVLLGNRTALLALDEFEVLVGAFEQGRFDESAILGMLRHLIQHRPQFKVLLSGTHTLEAFKSWASYLINLQVVPVSYLTEPEALQLITNPIPEFELQYEPDAVQRVIALTHCHPFLIQLLCAEIIALKNEQGITIRRWATLADVEAAVPQALTSASFFFTDIEQNQVSVDELAILKYMAARGEGNAITASDLNQYLNKPVDSLMRHLRQQDLIQSVDGGYCFQVELIRRWFAKVS
ncbi:AAA family ATPase [Acaryochloris marina]|uniref:AAA family ATPase n=1 Tax=Acaryochloris marina TaxID=155978 RepID=UPI0002E5BDBA|nr:AAA family ATPase [Acaryochloris marina]